MTRLVSIFFLSLLALSTLNGCGIKPDDVKSPAEGPDEFPRTYPDPLTDTR